MARKPNDGGNSDGGNDTNDYGTDDNSEAEREESDRASFGQRPPAPQQATSPIPPRPPPRSAH